MFYYALILVFFFLSAQNKFDEAVGHYNETLRINPEYVLAINNLANLLFKEGKIEEAVELYRDAITKDKTFALAHKNLGLVLKSIGKNVEGEAQY